MDSVLVVEDCLDTRLLIERALAGCYALRQCGRLAEAREALAETLPDLVLLDIGLPDGEGYALCSELRNDPETRSLPVVFLSGRNSVDAKVTAFGLDADDFVDKPFELAELRARVGARLRRRRSLEAQSSVRTIGPLRIDRDRFRAELIENGAGRDLDLTAHELRLLSALADATGRVLSRAQLCEALVGESVITERTIDTHLCNLRRKLGPQRNLVETVRGAGYRLIEPRIDAA